MKLTGVSRSLQMSVDYKIVEMNGKFCVKEQATDYIIKTFDNREEAKKVMKFLNLGGGFSGWTPSFLLNNSSKNM